MAQTGKSYVAITPANRACGFPTVDSTTLLLEASSQVYTKGAPVLLNASGYIAEGASIPQSIYGFARIAGQNGATDGAKVPSVYKAKNGELFIGTFEGTVSQSHIGALAMLSKSASSWFVKISTAASASYNVMIRGIRSPFAVGDTNPEILFSVLETKIQGDN